jgi:hypothetical protein
VSIQPSKQRLSDQEGLKKLSTILCASKTLHYVLEGSSAVAISNKAHQKNASSLHNTTSRKGALLFLSKNEIIM